MSFLRVDIAAFKAQVHDLLAAHPELVEDEQLREDMILGETEIDRIASRLVRIIGERKANADGLSTYIGELQERKAREMRGVDGARSLLKTLLHAGDLDKITLPEATVSITKPRIVVEVLDLDAIPQGFAKFEKRADKAALKAALEAGEEIPGAALILSDDGIMVRTK